MRKKDLSECHFSKGCSHDDVTRICYGFKQNTESKTHITVKFPESKAQGADSEAAGGGAPSTSSTVCRAAFNAEVNDRGPPGHGA